MRRNIYLDDHAHKWAAATGNVSGYIQDLIDHRISEHREALEVLRRFPHTSKMAVMDVLNGHLWTSGLSPALEITANLDDEPGLQDKWGITDLAWQELLGMSDRDALAFRVLAEELWAGRKTL